MGQQKYIKKWRMYTRFKSFYFNWANALLAKKIETFN